MSLQEPRIYDVDEAIAAMVKQQGREMIAYPGNPGAMRFKFDDYLEAKQFIMTCSSADLGWVEAWDFWKVYDRFYFHDEWMDYATKAEQARIEEVRASLEKQNTRKQSLLDYITRELNYETNAFIHVASLDFIETYLRDNFVAKEELE